MDEQTCRMNRSGTRDNTGKVSCEQPQAVASYPCHQGYGLTGLGEAGSRRQNHRASWGHQWGYLGSNRHPVGEEDSSLC